MESPREKGLTNISPFITSNDDNLNQIADQESSISFESSSKISHSGILKISAQNLHEQKLLSKRNMPEISPGFPSQQISPITFNYLTDVGQSTIVQKNLSAHLEDSQSFITSQFENEGTETNNLNSRIARILTDSKSELDARDHGEHKDGTDISIEILEQSDSSKLSFIKKKKKMSSKVTFDDSLNTDLLYDPSISSIHPSKNNDLIRERNKKKNFISVYSNRQIYLDGENNASEVRGRFKNNNTTVEYNSPNLIHEESQDDPRTQSLFEETIGDKSDPNEPRLSKLTDDQAALIFEKRKNRIFKGLKKLNKNRSFNTTKSNSSSTQTLLKASKLSENKSDIIRPLSVDNSPAGKQKITNLYIENIDKSTEKQKSPKGSTPKRISLTPQKVSKQHVESPEKKDGQGVKTVNVEISRRSRSLSPAEIRPSEAHKKVVTKQILIDGKKMIDEMFKLAKEDVQKRIASIDKRLIESGNYDSNISSRAEYEPADNKLKSVETSPNKSSDAIIEGLKSIPQTPEKKSNKMKEKSPITEEVKTVSENERARPDSDGSKLEETPKKESKFIKIPKAMTPPPSNVKQMPPKIPATNLILETPEKDRTVIKLNSVKLDRTPSSAKEKHTDSLMKKTSLQVSHSTEGIISNLEKRLEQCGRQSNSKTNLSKKLPNNGTVKFSDLEKMVTEKSSYTRIQYISGTEKEKKTNANTSMNTSTGAISKYRLEQESASQKAKPEQDPMKSFIETLKKVESSFKSQVLKESSDYKRTFHLKPKQNNEREAVHSTEYFLKQEKKAAKENTSEFEKKEQIKHFTIRPQSTEKTSQRKSSPYNLAPRAVESSLRFTPNSSKGFHDKSMVKEQKSIMQETGSPQVKEGKLPRSRSDTNIKKHANTKINKNIVLDGYFDERIANEQIQDYSTASTKNNKVTRQFTPKNTFPESTKSQKQTLTNSAVSRKTPLRSFVYESDRPNAPKGDYFKNLFSPPKRDSQDKKLSMLQKFEQSENNYLYVTAGENIDDLLKQNYKLLGIKNNQYVFSNN